MENLINKGEQFEFYITSGNKQIKYTFESLVDGLKLEDFSKIILLYGLSWEQEPYTLYLTDKYLNQNYKVETLYIARLITIEILDLTFKGILAGEESIPGCKNV